MKFHIPAEFNEPWCQRILQGPEIEIIDVPNADTPTGIPEISNTMFLRTLRQPDGIRAQIDFTRPICQPEGLTRREFCYLISIGDGVDGKTGRAHGGFNALVLDHMSGWVASHATGTMDPATATLTIDYKAPIETPGIILCRGWLLERSGRKIWVQAAIEDSSGKTLARSKALFVSARNRGKI